jgi:hypothetical protein
MSKDYEKHNEAVRLGWKILYIMSNQLTPETINETIQNIHSIITNERIEIPTPSRIIDNLIDRSRRYLDQEPD